MVEIFKVNNSTPLITCFVTHNRLDLTKLALNSFINTTRIDHNLVVVDSGSDKETVDYLHSVEEIDILLLEPNIYPGAAINLGWEAGLERWPETRFLMRSDNDIFYRFGWDIYAFELFDRFHKLGELGLIDLTDKFFFGTRPEVTIASAEFRYNAVPFPIGGAYIIRKQIWDQGVRHPEGVWDKNPDTPEDKVFWKQIVDKGWKTGCVMDPLVCHLGIGYGWNETHDNYEYSKRVFEQRSLDTWEKFLDQMYFRA